MKIPRKVLRTTLMSIRQDRAAGRVNEYVVEIEVNGAKHSEVFEVDGDGTIGGIFEALELRWWAMDIVVSYLRRYARDEFLQFPIDLGDLGDPALAGQLDG